MLLSVLAGTFLYIVIQYVWYSPLAFGKQWLLLQQTRPEETLEEIAQANTLSNNLRNILFPALIMSMAINALFVVLERFEPLVFFGATLGLFLLTVGKKYLGWQQTKRGIRETWCIYDGALLVSLLLLALLTSFLLG